MKILTIANIVKRKRVDLCAHACAELEKMSDIDTLTWSVIGRGKLLDDVKTRSPQAMKFLTYVESLREYYRQADVFVLPSYGEGFGMVYIEAIMCGCPVICRKGDGGEGIVRNTGGGLAIEIPDDDKAAVANIVEAILDISENRQKYMNDSIVHAARQMVDPERIRKMWSDLLRDIDEPWQWPPQT